MKKTLAMFIFIFVLSGCTNEFETTTEDYDDVAVFTVVSDNHLGAEATVEEFNKQLNTFFENYEEDKDVIATFVEPINDYMQHTITVYYFSESIDDILKKTSNPIQFAKYRNSTDRYSEYIKNNSGSSDDSVNDMYFDISIGEYKG